jgi:beta-lactamase superfamily II metal-dependent hydrolase
MIFTLEALEAAHGDALLLHYGPPDSAKLVVIDGGPTGIYRSSVLPRLEELRARRAPDATLAIDYVLVSHIDDDHIHGITDLTKDLVGVADSPEAPPFEITNLWHNAFNDVVGDDEVQAVAPAAVMAALEPAAGGVQLAGADPLALLRSEVEPEGMSRETALVLASVGQGNQLRHDAERLDCIVNDDKPLWLAPVETDMGHGLKATIVGPLRAQLEALQAEWDKQIKKKKASPKEHVASMAAFVDKSVPNLSSIVVLAELEGKTMLLTGDARGDFVLEGLKAAGALDDETLHVDVLKVPHHGSNRDVETEWFRKITADHYVISANGKFGNPDEETLEMIAAARGRDEFTIHLTNHDGQDDLRGRLDAFVAKQKAAGAKFRVAYRGEPDPIKIELGDLLGF